MHAVADHGERVMAGQLEEIPEPRRALGLALAKFREASSLNQADLGRLTHYSRTTISHIEAARQLPGREFWEIADAAYGANGGLVAQYDEVCEAEDRKRIFELEQTRAERRKRAASDAQSYLCSPYAHRGPQLEEISASYKTGAPIDSDYIEGLHHDIKEYVRLDQRQGGGITSQLIVQGFHQARRRMETSEIRKELKRDTLSAVSEIAEVAGWSLYDAEHHDQAQEMNIKALSLARKAGDRSMELFILQNMSMHAGHLGRARESLDIAHLALSMGHLSPRVQSLFRLREARSLAQLGAATDARRQLKRAKELHSEGIRDDDPHWSWWVDETEFAWHEGMLTTHLGDKVKALDFFDFAASGIPERRTRTYYSYRASALLSHVINQSWVNAEQSMLALLKYAGFIGSRRGDRTIELALNHLDHLNAPDTIRDLSLALRVALVHAP